MKNKDTGEYFKAMVRILKNMRNRMIDKGLLKEGVAPSYFLEGMLWNVPPEHFGESYGATFAASMNWLLKANISELACANDLYWLLRDNAAVCWNEADFHTFMSAAIKQWNEWEG